MKRRRQQRGLTLLEAVLALAVFTTGVAALFGMISNVSQANRSMAFQNNALDLYTTIATQIRDAQCEYDGNLPAAFTPGMTDLGLTLFPVVHGGLVAPTLGSGIVAVGDAASNPAVFQDYVPPMRASYVVNNVTPPPVGGNPPPPVLRIDVTIREIFNDPVKDGMATATWIKTYPIEKVCAARYDGVPPRGAFR